MIKMMSDSLDSLFFFDSRMIGAALMGWLVFILVHQQTNLLLHYFYRNLPSKSHCEKVVWIIGASSGIGEALAREYAQQGASLILSARRLDRLTEVADECCQYGERPMVLPLDITHLSEHPNYVAKVLAVFEKVDIVILNSGKFQFKAAMDTSFEQTEDIVRLNLLSHISITKLLLPSMIKSHTGKVLNAFIQVPKCLYVICVIDCCD